MEEWVETSAVSVKLAVQAALDELGLQDESQAEIKIIQESQRGFLGIGGQDAIVQVKPLPKRPKKKRGGKPPGRPAKTEQKRSSEAPSKGYSPRPMDRNPDQEDVQIVRNFLQGLLEEFGLEGEVDVRIERNIIRADIRGEQTEALVGPKASILQAVHELTKTILQRKTAKRLRVRLDIAGYAERRQAALVIYAGKLAEQVLKEETEIMLEPMNAGDRKVVHDVIADVEGVRSFSEGEEPRRSVVIAPD